LPILNNSFRDFMIGFLRTAKIAKNG